MIRLCSHLISFALSGEYCCPLTTARAHDAAQMPRPSGLGPEFTILPSDPTFWSDFAISLHYLLHRAIAGAARSSALGSGAAIEEWCVGHRHVSFRATYRSPVARHADVLFSQRLGSPSAASQRRDFYLPHLQIEQ